MNTKKAFFLFYMGVVVIGVVSPFHFITRKWDFGDSRDTIDTLTTDNGNLFLTRNNKMQWLRPLLDKPIIHLSRDFPRTIHGMSVHKKSILVNMSPEKEGAVSETLVFANDKCFRMSWNDNTMYETLVVQNGYLLRSNYYGNITYGNHENVFTYNTKILTNMTYSAMTVYGKYLWCATEYTTPNNTRITRIDAFDLFVNVNGVNYISGVPEMTFLFDNKGCASPCQLCVSIEKFSPTDIVYIIVGYMKGGVNVAQAFYPTEKKMTSVMCSNLPNENPIRSLSWDRPYLFFLDGKTISSYNIYPRMDIHRYLGKYTLPLKFFSETTQIVSLKKQVFWNGENTLYSAEVVED